MSLWRRFWASAQPPHMSPATDGLDSFSEAVCRLLRRYEDPTRPPHLSTPARDMLRGHWLWPPSLLTALSSAFGLSLHAGCNPLTAGPDHIFDYCSDAPADETFGALPSSTAFTWAGRSTLLTPPPDTDACLAAVRRAIAEAALAPHQSPTLICLLLPHAPSSRFHALARRPPHANVYSHAVCSFPQGHIILERAAAFPSRSVPSLQIPANRAVAQHPVRLRRDCCLQRCRPLTHPTGRAHSPASRPRCCCCSNSWFCEHGRPSHHAASYPCLSARCRGAWAASACCSLLCNALPRRYYVASTSNTWHELAQHFALAISPHEEALEEWASATSVESLRGVLSSRTCYTHRSPLRQRLPTT